MRYFRNCIKRKKNDRKDTERHLKVLFTKINFRIFRMEIART